MPVTALLGVDQALDRGRGRTQDHRHLAEMPSHHRHVARLIGDALLLLVARVVLFIDDDQAEIGEGEEEGRAGADHELRLVLGHGAPDAAAQGGRDARMPLGRARAETLLAAVDELTGECDLGHEHEHLPAARERRRDRLEIDFGLARAGDPVEQRHGEAAAGIGEQRAGGRSLLSGELRALTRQIERQRVPVGQRLGDQRAGIDQPVDHPWAHAGRLGEARFHPDQTVLRRFDHAGPRRGHALGRRADEPYPIAGRGRGEGATRAHHHAQHHAGGGQGVVRDPIGEVERDARQRGHVLDHFDDGAELLAVDLGWGRPLRAPPYRAEIINGTERCYHEPAGLGPRAFGQQVVVRRWQCERQQDGNRRRRAGRRSTRLGLSFGQGRSQS